MKASTSQTPPIASALQPTPASSATAPASVVKPLLLSILTLVVLPALLVVLPAPWAMRLLCLLAVAVVLVASSGAIRAALEHLWHLVVGDSDPPPVSTTKTAAEIMRSQEAADRRSALFWKRTQERERIEVIAFVKAWSPVSRRKLLELCLGSPDRLDEILMQLHADHIVVLDGDMVSIVTAPTPAP